MNKAQTQAVQSITRAVSRSAQYSTREGWLNGPVTFTVQESGKDVLVFASNIGDEKAWFETYCFACFVVGPRGGVALQDCEGFSRAALARI